MVPSRCSPRGGRRQNHDTFAIDVEEYRERGITDELMTLLKSELLG